MCTLMSEGDKGADNRKEFGLKSVGLHLVFMLVSK